MLDKENLRKVIWHRGSVEWWIRRPLECDHKRFILQPTPHLWLVGAFGWRLLVVRYGPSWWEILNRFECWKYMLPKWLK